MESSFYEVHSISHVIFIGWWLFDCKIFCIQKAISRSVRRALRTAGHVRSGHVTGGSDESAENSKTIYRRIDIMRGQRQMPSVSLETIAGVAQGIANFLQTMAESSSQQPYGQQSRGKNQRWAPGTKATSGSRRKRQQSRSGNSFAHGRFVPTRSKQEDQELLNLLEESGVGGQSVKITLPIS